MPEHPFPGQNQQWNTSDLGRNVFTGQIWRRVGGVIEHPGGVVTTSHNIQSQEDTGNDPVAVIAKTGAY
jgi:hypothetical protein